MLATWRSPGGAVEAGVPASIALAAALAAALFAIGCDRGPEKPKVVVYCSADDHYAKPVLDEFERQTGIQVLALFDTEANKTTGLYQKVLSEMGRPRADVFWNSEVLRTVLLADKGALAELPPVPSGIPPRYAAADGRWTGISARARVIIYNTELVPAAEAPRSLADLAEPAWKGRWAMPLPLFGTAAAHAGALRAV